MYKYVKDKEFLKRAQAYCSSLVKELENELRGSEGINSQFFLVGSGGRNMVTQNENGDIDFDYNLNMISCQDWDAKSIKETVRKSFNKIMRKNGLDNVQDSTSSLTTARFYLKDMPNIGFSIDVAIVKKSTNGLWERLIHQKTGYTFNDSWIWNIAPNSTQIKEKASIIKKSHLWGEVRETYLRKKNMYLRRNDNNHSSFNCYIESVNEVYDKCEHHL